MANISLLAWAKKFGVGYSQARKMVERGQITTEKVGSRVLVDEFQQPPPEQKIACAICGARVSQITVSHLRQHGHTVKSYKTAFPDAPIVSADVAASISQAITGTTRSDEVRARVSAGRKGIVPKDHPRFEKGAYRASEATRAKMAAAHTGKTHSEATKAKIGATRRGKTLPDAPTTKVTGLTTNWNEIPTMTLFEVFIDDEVPPSEQPALVLLANRREQPYQARSAVDPSVQITEAHDAEERGAETGELEMMKVITMTATAPDWSMKIVMSEDIDYRLGPDEDVRYACEGIEVTGNLQGAAAWAARHKSANYALDDGLPCVAMAEKRPFTYVAPRTPAGNDPDLLAAVFPNYQRLGGRKTLDELDAALRVFFDTTLAAYIDGQGSRRAAVQRCMKEMPCSGREFDRIFRAVDMFSAYS